MLARLAALLLVLAFVAGCGDDADTTTAPPAVTSEPTEAATDVPAEATATPAAKRGLKLDKVGEFDQPVFVTSPPDDAEHVYVVEQGGVIRLIGSDEPFLDLSGQVTLGSEQGLLSMAFAPDYARSDRFYVYYTTAEGTQRVAEYQASSPERADPDTARTVLEMEDPESNHNGGLLLFGPDDLLYIGTGDGGGAGDQHGERGNGQDLGSLLGKILRINPGGNGEGGYTVPDDNPFVGEPGAKEEIYAYGLRNPWRFSFDRETGDLTIGDVGQGEIEEIDFVPAADGAGAGDNFGWRPFEGSQEYSPGEDAPGHVEPVIEQTHDDGNCSITGGVVVRDAGVPGALGRYLFGDFCLGQVFSAELDTPQAKNVKPTGLEVANLSSFGEDADGRVYLVSLSGPVYRLAAGMSEITVMEGVSDVVQIRASNGGPFTLTGTNTWVLSRDPCWVVDPGPNLPDHLDAIAAVVAERGGLGGVALTHSHHDHTDAVPALLERLDGTLDDGPLERVPLPGHSDDHVVFVWNGVCCAGDAVLGEGSVFVAGDMGAYLDGLRGLRERGLRLICPGHGPPVFDPDAKLDQYLAHRLDRERRLVEALDAGVRGDDALLDRVWDDAPAHLRIAAGWTMASHLRKLGAEGRLPDDFVAPAAPDVPEV